MAGIAQTNADIFQELDRQNKDFQDNAARFRRKHYRSPYSDEMLKKIAQSGLEPIYINIIKPHVKTLVGMMYSNKNSVTAIPINGDSKMAFAAQAALTALFQYNQWPLTYRRVLTDQMISGIGFAMVDRDDSFTPNPFGVKLKYMDFAKCRWSTNYSHPLMDDLDMFAYYDMMTIKSAIVRSGKPYSDKMLTDVTEQISSLPDVLSANPLFDQSFKERRFGRMTENTIVPWFETYRKDYKNYQRLIYKKDGNVIRSEMIPVGKSEGGKELQGYDNVMSYFYSEKDGGSYAKDKVEELKKVGDLQALKLERVVKSVSVGGYSIGEYVLPTQHYPFVPFVYDMQEGGVPVGAVEDLESIYTALNQTVLLTLLNARLQCNFHIMAPTGSIKDMDAFELQWSKTGSVVEVDPVSVGGSQPMMPVPVYAQQLPSTFGDLTQMLIKMAEYSSSVSEALQGINTGEKPSGVALEQLQSYGGLKFRPHAETNQASLSRLGKVAFDFAKQLMPNDVIIRFKEEDDDFLESISITDDEKQDTGLLAQRVKDEKSAIAQRVNMPGYNVEMPLNYRVQVGEDVVFVNDFKNSETDLDFRIVAAPSTESQRYNWQAVIGNMIRQFPEMTPVLGPEALKMLDYPNADKLFKKMDVLEQTRAQLRDALSQIEILKSEQVNLMQQNIRTKMSADVTKVTADYKMKLEKMLNDMKLELASIESSGQDVDGNGEKIRQQIQSLEAFMASQMQDVSPQGSANSVEQTLPEGSL